LSFGRILIPLLAAAAGIGGGLAFMNAVGPDINSGTTTTNAAGETVAVPETPSGPPPELNGGDEQSMLRPEQFAKALAVLRKEGGGRGARVSNLRLAPGRINTTVEGDGKDVSLYLIPDGKVYSRSDSASSSTSPIAVKVRDIPAGAPWKIVTSMQEKAGIEPDDIDYMVAIAGPPAPNGEWLIYPKGGATHWVAALNGAHPTRCC
jgi:hypothetical protein